MEPLVHLTVDLLPEILLIMASRAKGEKAHAVVVPDLRSVIKNNRYSHEHSID